MLRLLDAPVTADEIDHLGHMNVRFYSKRAWLAAQAYFARQGLDDETLRARGLALTPRDQLGHFFREQHEGAPLVVDGAMTEVDGDPRLYVEILNAGSGERAAAFIVMPALTHRATRTPAPADLPWTLGPRIPLPPHAAPRSLSLERPRLDVALAELDQRCAGWNFPHAVMEGSAPADACDETGFMIVSGAQDIGFLAIDATAARRGHLFVSGDHATFGWAMLENRQYLVATPRAGDRVRLISAEVRIDRKAHWNRRWAFNADTGQLFGITDSVSLAFDPATRRSLEIPPQTRRDLEAQSLPDLV